MSVHTLTSLAAAHPQYAAVVGVVVLAVALVAVRKLTSGRRAEDVLTLVAAVIATTVAGTGMWRFFSVTLHFSGPLRVLLFAFIEVAVFTSALRARRNVSESSTHSAGVDGAAVWALTGLSAVLSALDARSFAEVLFRLVAPLVAAWLWERSMAVERRRITGRSIHWRITPERALVRLGLAEASDRTAGEVDAHRRLTRVARAAKRVRALRSAGARAWRLRRAQRRLDAAMGRAVEYASLATDPDRQDALMAQLGALYHAATLAELSPPAPWDRPAPNLVDIRHEVPPAVDRKTLDLDPFPDPPRRLSDWLEGDGQGDEEDDDEGTVPDPDPALSDARERFRDVLSMGAVPSIRAIKRELRVGWDRATRIHAALGENG